jgi:hypothetical protein
MSSLNSLRLFVDVHGKRLVTSPFDPSTPTLPEFVKDDIYHIEAYPLIPNVFSGLGNNPYEPITSTTLWTLARLNFGTTTTGAESILLGDLIFTAEQRLYECSVLVGGTNYTVGDILKVTNGTQVEAAKVEVTAVESGVVAAVRIYDEGAHTSGVAQPSTGRPTTIEVTANASASGCTLIAKFAQTFIGLLDLSHAAIDTLLSSTTATTNLEVRLETTGGSAKFVTILQTPVTIKENLMDTP